MGGSKAAKPGKNQPRAAMHNVIRRKDVVALAKRVLDEKAHSSLEEK